MRSLLSVLFVGLFPIISLAQSSELKTSYNEVLTTLKEYRFQSEDVYWCDYDLYETKTITLKLSKGCFVFSFTDKYKEWGWHSDAHPGIKTITIPIDETTFKFDKSYCGGYITIGGINGIEYALNNKKEIISSYRVYGTELNANKLYKELLSLLFLAKSEHFQGSLGATTNNKSSSSTITDKNKSKTNPNNKKVGKYVQ